MGGALLSMTARGWTTDMATLHTCSGINFKSSIAMNYTQLTFLAFSKNNSIVDFNMPGIHGEICTFYSSLPLDANWTSTSASNVVKMSVTLVDDAG